MARYGTAIRGRIRLHGRKTVYQIGKEVANLKSESLEEIVESGRLDRSIRGYLKTCRPEDGDKKSGRFPNLAGFCRRLGCGLSAIEQLRATHPEAVDYLLAVLEDEALNAPVVSATVVGAYLKRRLSYGEKALSDISSTDCGETRLIFEHDIAEDGA